MALAATLVSAAPLTPTPSRTLERRGGSSCTFTSAASASASAGDCSVVTLRNIAVPAGESLELNNLKAGTQVVFQGETTFGYKEWKGPLIRIQGDSITVRGDPGHVINGGGEQWWDGKGSNSGKTKPKFFYAHGLDNSIISGLYVKNTPVQAFSIQSKNLVLDHITIDNSEGDRKNGGHNTDAFDVGESVGITIQHANVKNQDDCLAVNSGEANGEQTGTKNIIFTDGTCSGGHGLSIGSVGGRDDNTVKNVTISNSVVANSANGLRIKTVAGATGSVDQVNYSNITLSNISDYGIVIEQDYENGGPTGKPTTGVPITGVSVDGVHGSVDEDAQGHWTLGHRRAST
ncbi:Polygalacturonase 1 [Monascus purpureus]|uniref:endo-polygalacturonase n=1 Tax=Monascus purpureus TaxID=5098 RepID=A0A507QL00_MONPU|nr:Polygalacturonase 1 [Monascus purpureus]